MFYINLIHLYICIYWCVHIYSLLLEVYITMQKVIDAHWSDIAVHDHFSLVNILKKVESPSTLHNDVILAT